MVLINKIKIKPYHWLLAVAIIFFIVFLLAIICNFWFDKKYQEKIYPGLYLGEVNLGGYTAEQAKSIINKKIDSINQAGVSFAYNQDKKTVYPVISSLQSDSAYQIIDFSVEDLIHQAASFGRDGNFIVNFQNKIKALGFGQPLTLKTVVNQEEMTKILKESFARWEAPAQNAELIISPEENISIQEEKLGKVINYQGGINQLTNNLSRLDNSTVALFTVTDYPRIYKNNVLNVTSTVKQILDLAPVTMKYLDNNWLIERQQLTDWLSLKVRPETGTSQAPDIADGQAIIGLNNNKFYQFLSQIEATINLEPIDAKFEIKNGRVIEFQGSRDGREVNVAASLTKLEQSLISNGDKEIELVVKELKSKIQTEAINNLGIREIIGTGESNFSGSPVNRRHNIKIGADSLNGLLIKPNEEFSLIKALGKIEASTGYLPELVIKGNQTIPEYGGGLCQIGTTMFRATLASGLPITMRQNHSYRVVYYEPAGTDATIYDPWPDFRFINDTGNYILIQSRIEGDNLFFDFWGTADGRQVERSEPTIYNIVRPGPTKYIETLDLPAGEKKCTERAHNGADAYFDYKVIYANQEIKERRFTSHYIPWQEVCLIGVEKLSEQTDNDGAASSTAEIIDQ